MERLCSCGEGFCSKHSKPVEVPDYVDQETQDRLSMSLRLLREFVKHGTKGVVLPSTVENAKRFLEG